jgi:hypothetical protein
MVESQLVAPKNIKNKQQTFIFASAVVVVLICFNQSSILNPHMMLTSSWNTTYQWSFLMIILDDSIVYRWGHKPTGSPFLCRWPFLQVKARVFGYSNILFIYIYIHIYGLPWIYHKLWHMWWYVMILIQYWNSPNLTDTTRVSNPLFFTATADVCVRLPGQCCGKKVTLQGWCETNDGYQGMGPPR